MALETAENVNDLVVTNPTGADPKSAGDDHLRNIKRSLRNNFTGFPGAILITGVDGGAVNAYTLTPAHALVAYGTKMVAEFTPTVANTGPCTLNVSNLGAKALLSVAGAPLVAGDLLVGSIYSAFYDGVQFRLTSVTKNYVDQLAFASSLPTQSPGFLRSDGTSAGFSATHTGYAQNEVLGAPIASAATINLTTATGNLVHVTGAVQISAITIPVGAERTVILDGAPKLVHSAALLLPSAAAINAQPGDRFTVRGDTGGAIVTSYTRASGAPVIGGAKTMVVLTAGGTWVVPDGVIAAEVTVVDGGGGGEFNTGGSTAAFYDGGRGGNGGTSILALIPGTTCTAIIGAGAASTNLGSNTGGATSFSGTGFTTLTSSNAALKVPGGLSDQGVNTIGPGRGGGSMLAPSASTGYGAGGRGGSGDGGSPTAGTAGVVIIKY